MSLSRQKDWGYRKLARKAFEVLQADYAELEVALKTKEVADVLEENETETSKATDRRKLGYLQDSENSVRRFEGEGRGSPNLYYRDAGTAFSTHGEEEI
jgi:hypothetical protein